ncbi:MAG: hypothetical protein NTV72_00790 [Candidatus Taylorbacteria bacterium]|nr:hypothetical protein [Candidatus Taylorbacteria bacterium]
MQYIKVNWIHSDPEYPIMIYSELSDSRIETRKVEIWSNGKIGFSDLSESTNTTKFSEDAVPSIPEISKDSQFQPAEISKNEFEIIWSKRNSKVS